ncbi:MAG: coproporphyrinogen dehydrogenase HemZ [Lachnospiraceae bacterium]|nr:coproporphyrinogen dehydrogenase HemZ [Lachnospiraceae bacterium]
MLVIRVDKERLEYDIRAIVTSFYPEEDVRIELAGSLHGNESDEGESSDRVMEIRVCEDPATLSFNGKTYCFRRGFLQAKDRSFSGEEKDDFKEFLYLTLCEHTKTTLPWGNLTGIRPTKIAMGMIEEGKSDEEILSFLEKRHFVSEKKRKLCVDIAHREAAVLSPLHKTDGYSLYIGIPFCPSRCLYCSFTSNPIAAFSDAVEPYVDCLIREMRQVAEVYRDKILDTVYVGGGTPTALSGAQLDRLLTALYAIFPMEQCRELTVEAGRADSITREKLEVLKRHGVTRISVNPQTMHDSTLEFIGRKHTTADVYRAYREACDVGFDNINMDIILGLPGEGEQEVKETIEAIREFSPASLTVHSLAVKRASRLREWIEKNGRSLIRNTDACMEVARAGAESMGLKPYYLYRQKNMSGNFENVGYAAEGKYGIYNILIMEEIQPIMALGAGSVSKAVLPDGRIERTDNVKDVRMYIDKIDEMLKRKEVLFDLQREQGWL